MQQVRKAVFPVAGLGTRFLPATKAVPKEVLPLVDKPLIQYAIDEARAAGITDFIFVTAKGKSALEDYFDGSPELVRSLKAKGKTDLLQAIEPSNMASGAISYIRQQEALGLGHAVWCARRLVGDEPGAEHPPCLLRARGGGGSSTSGVDLGQPRRRRRGARTRLSRSVSTLRTRRNRPGDRRAGARRQPPRRAGRHRVSRGFARSHAAARRQTRL